MGTDTVERLIPCQCGLSKIVVATSTPDHGWSYEASHSFTIECDACRLEYVVSGTSLVRRVDQIAHEAALKRWRLACEHFENSPDVVAVKHEFSTYLDSLKFVSKIHRYLTKQGLNTYSDGTFRKKWKNAKDWVMTNIRLGHLRIVLVPLGHDPKKFDDELHHLDFLKSEVPTVPIVRLLLKE